MLYYKKPGFWIIVVAAIMCGAIAIGFLTDPIDPVNVSTSDNLFWRSRTLGKWHAYGL